MPSSQRRRKMPTPGWWWVQYKDAIVEVVRVTKNPGSDPQIRTTGNEDYFDIGSEWTFMKRLRTPRRRRYRAK